MESLCIPPYTSVNVHVDNGQQSKPENQRGQWSKCQRAGQSFDLEVVAMTIESIGMTSP